MERGNTDGESDECHDRWWWVEWAGVVAYGVILRWSTCCRHLVMLVVVVLVVKVQAPGCVIIISSQFGDVADTVTGVGYHCVIVNGHCVIIISY